MKNRFIFLFLMLFSLVSLIAHSAEETPIPPNPTEIHPQITPNDPPVAPNITDQDLFFKEFLNMLTTLGLIIAALLFLSWFVKRMMNTRVQQLNTSSLIKIIERRSISPKAQLYLVEIHGKTLVLGESHLGLTKITEYQGLNPSVEEEI